MKLIDFTNLEQLKLPTEKSEKLRQGNLRYMSPQQLENQKTFTNDIWSFGCILFYMFTGIEPYQGLDDNEIYQKIMSGIDPIDHLQE